MDIEIEEVENKDKKIKEKDLIETMNEDLKEATAGKREFEEVITECLDLIKGEGFVQEEGRSKIVVMDALKQTRWALVQMAAPFTTEAKPITVKPTNQNNIEQADKASEYLNYVVLNKLGWKKYVKKSIQQFINEGAAIGKVIWKTKTKVNSDGWELINVDHYDGFKAELEANGRTIIDEKEFQEDGFVNVEVGTITVIDDRFDIEQIPFENFFPDPSASVITPKEYDCDYVIEKRTMSFSQLEQIGEAKGWKNIDVLKKKYSCIGKKASSEELMNEYGYSDNTLKEYRKYMLPGKVDGDINRNTRRNKVNIYIEHGLLDFNDDGVEVMCETVFSGDTILSCEQSTYPDDSIPFVFCAFDQSLFSIYGTPFVKYMEDGMRVRTALMRGYIDHVAYSNYGITLAKVGALDPTQMERLEKKEIGSVIEVNGNPNEVLRELIPTSIPNQHYNLYEMWAQEQEHATGFQRLGQGQSSKYSANTASGQSMAIQAGQQRVNDLISDIKEGYIEPCLSQSLLLASEMLDEETFSQIIGDKHMSITAADIDPSVKVQISINLTGQNDVRIQQIIQILSQTAVLVDKGIASSAILKEMFKKLLNAYNFKDIEYMVDSIDETMPKGSKSFYDVIRSIDSDLTDEEAMELAEMSADKLLKEMEQLNEEAKRNQAIEEKQGEAQSALADIEKEEDKRVDDYNKGQADRKSSLQGKEYTAPVQISPIENSQKRLQQEVDGGGRSA